MKRRVISFVLCALSVSACLAKTPLDDELELLNKAQLIVIFRMKAGKHDMVSIEEVIRGNKVILKPSLLEVLARGRTEGKYLMAKWSSAGSGRLRVFKVDKAGLLIMSDGSRFEV